MQAEALAVKGTGPDPVLRRVAWLFLGAAFVGCLGIAKIYSAIDKPLTHPWAPAINSAIGGLFFGVALLILANGLRQGRLWALRLAVAALLYQVVRYCLVIPSLVFWIRRFAPVVAGSKMMSGLLVASLVYGVLVFCGVSAVLVILCRPSLRRRVAAWDQTTGPGTGLSWICLVLCVALAEFVVWHVLPPSSGVPFFGLNVTDAAAWGVQFARLTAMAGTFYLLWIGHPRAWFCVLMLLAAGAASDVLSFCVLGNGVLQGFTEISPVMHSLKLDPSHFLNDKVDLFMLELRWGLLLLLGFIGAFKAWRETFLRPGAGRI